MTVATRASSLLEAILVFTHLNPWMNRLWFHCGSFRNHILTRKQIVWSWKHDITALLHRSTYWKLLGVQRCSRSELLHLWSASLTHRSFAKWLFIQIKDECALVDLASWFQVCYSWWRKQVGQQLQGETWCSEEKAQRQADSVIKAIFLNLLSVVEWMIWQRSILSCGFGAVLVARTWQPRLSPMKPPMRVGHNPVMSYVRWCNNLACVCLYLSLLAWTHTHTHTLSHTHMSNWASWGELTVAAKGWRNVWRPLQLKKLIVTH